MKKIFFTICLIASLANLAFASKTGTSSKDLRAAGMMAPGDVPTTANPVPSSVQPVDTAAVIAAAQRELDRQTGQNNQSVVDINRTGGMTISTTDATVAQGLASRSEGGETQSNLNYTPPTLKKGADGSRDLVAGGGSETFWGKPLPVIVKDWGPWMYGALAVVALAAGVFFRLGPPLLRNANISNVCLVLAGAFVVMAYQPWIGVIGGIVVLAIVGWPLIQKSVEGSKANTELDKMKAAYSALARAVYDPSLPPSVGAQVRAALNNHGPNDGSAQDMFDAAAQAAGIGPFHPAAAYFGSAPAPTVSAPVISPDLIQQLAAALRQSTNPATAAAPPIAPVAAPAAV